MLRAVPATMLIADSMVKQFRSGILISAIVRTWSQVTEPTLLRFDSLDPLFTLANSSSCTAAGGVLMTNSKDLSVYTVMITGNTLPAWSWVRALNCLQNSMMFTPLAPSAGPIGGAGLAAPPFTWSFMNVLISFAMMFK